jgi:UDP-N-acetylglucosamine 2-epimerase
MAPVIHRLAESEDFDPLVISTGQHREMIDDVCAWFGVKPDVDLKLMTPNQSLSGYLGAALVQLESILAKARPDAVLVQGDTMSTLAGAISAFHLSIPVGHVEAGLRTYNLQAPFPEEANRTMVSRIVAWHFAPTDRAVGALQAERVPGKIWKTGNTIVDALLSTAARVGESAIHPPGKRIVLITGHRRENFGARFDAAFKAISSLSRRYPEIDFIYPVHLNPRVRAHANDILGNHNNVRLLDPLPYPELVALIKRADLVLTDSGGIQEEAPSFGVPVLVMRDTTERPEGVETGVARLVGTDPERITNSVSELLDDHKARESIANIPNPYGDGQASARILEHLRREIDS